MDKLADLVADKMMQRMQGDGLPGQPAPIEDVEPVGEKINYKIALSPEVFRYTVFKAQVLRRGRKWDGSLSDFIDI
jgi:hypothetical protein